MSLSCFAPKRQKFCVVSDGFTAGPPTWITRTHATVDLLHGGALVATAKFRAGRKVEISVIEPPHESRRLFALEAMQSVLVETRGELFRMSERVPPDPPTPFTAIVR